MYSKARKEGIYFVFLIVMILFFRIFVFSPVSVSGSSMEPTLYSGEKGIILKKGNLEHKDIICFIGDQNTKEIFIKRIIGMPGDYIYIRENEIFINGMVLEEDYLTDYPFNSDFNLTNLENTEFIVPEDSFFVLGDNRVISLDSRVIGYIPKDNIIGKLIVSFGIRNY